MPLSCRIREGYIKYGLLIVRMHAELNPHLDANMKETGQTFFRVTLIHVYITVTIKIEFVNLHFQEC